VSSSSRAERLAALLAERELDQLLVGDLVRPGDSAADSISNLRWLTGFSGTSGLAIVGPEDRVFLTDFRYLERAEREVAAEFERAAAERELLAGAVGRLRGRVGYDDAQTSVKNLRKLEQLVPDRVELVAAGGLVEGLRRSKDPGELEAIAEAARLADEVYEWTFDRGVVGRTEREIMLDAHQRMRELGADDPSFPAIVAAGENSALPHHTSSEREVAAGELVLIDMGATVDGYCSDCTRTVGAGEIDDEAREVYELVRSAQAMALEAIRAGMHARDADSVARDPIARAGHAEHFGHGLGHGVGLEVHEAPRLSQRSDQTLEVGDVVTIEPGIYLPGRFGVRIEDLVTVTYDGCRNLSTFPKKLTVLDS
jgi:Xaa-Pro aminopeptidase